MVAVVVTENPVGVKNLWEVPSTKRPGVPIGQVIYQNQAVVIPAVTTDTLAISINCALDIGYAYRMMDARVQIALLNQAGEFGRIAAGQLVAFNPSIPSQTINIPFALSNTWFGQTADDALEARTDASALPVKLIYQPAVPLPNMPLTAQSATTVARIFIASASDTIAAGELTYFLRFLIYTIADDEAWAINSPVPVTF